MYKLQWISENQKSFDTICKALNNFCDENELFICKWRFDIPLEQHYLRYVKTNNLPFRTIGTPMSSSK